MEVLTITRWRIIKLMRNERICEWSENLFASVQSILTGKLNMQSNILKILTHDQKEEIVCEVVCDMLKCADTNPEFMKNIMVIKRMEIINQSENDSFLWPLEHNSSLHSQTKCQQQILLDCSPSSSIQETTTWDL